MTFGPEDMEPIHYMGEDGKVVLVADDAPETEKQKSLVRELVYDHLIPAEIRNAFGFEFKNEYDMRVPVLDFQVMGDDNVWQTINDLLREYGYILRVDNLTITVVDILKQDSTGVELLDGADISAKTNEVDMGIPKVKYMQTLDSPNELLYTGQLSIWAFIVGHKREDDLPLSFRKINPMPISSDADWKYVKDAIKHGKTTEEAIAELEAGRKDDSAVVQSITNIDYNPGSIDVIVDSVYINKGMQTFHRKVHTNPFHLGSVTTETLRGDVRYRVYRNGVSPATLPEGFHMSSDTIEPKYLYQAENVERYIKSLIKIKTFQHTEWTFYSKVKLNVDDIVRFKDIPDSTCRIYEVQDTLEMDGGYTYKAFPYTDADITFNHVEEDVTEPDMNFIKNIYPEEPIFIENGTYRKPKWKIIIDTNDYRTVPTVTINNVPIDVEFDGKTTKFYVKISLTDTDMEYIEVKAKVDASEETVQIPIYKTENRPVIIEYKYSTSSTDPHADSFRLNYGKYALTYGAWNLIYGNEAWTQRIPVGARYDGMYLWKRTWNYNIDEWVYEMLSTVEKFFKIDATPSIYTISHRNIVGTDVLIKVLAKGYKMEDVVVEADHGTLTKQPNNNSQWNLLLDAGIRETKVHITATCGTETAETWLDGIVADDKPVYGGILATAPTEGLMVGDYYLTEAGVPQIWTGTAWKNVESTDDGYATIMDVMGKDWLVHGHDINEAVSALYAYFGLVYSDAIITKNLNVTSEDGKFKTEIKGAKAQSPAVFDVQYDKGNGMETIFRIAPSSGRIFMGRPNADATAPETGFMYDPFDESISTKGGKFKVGTDGRLIANDGFFGGQFDCTSIYTDESPINPVPVSTNRNDKAQIRTFWDTFKAQFGITSLNTEEIYRCRIVNGSENIKYLRWSNFLVNNDSCIQIYRLAFLNKNMELIIPSDYGVPVSDQNWPTGHPVQFDNYMVTTYQGAGVPPYDYSQGAGRYFTNGATIEILQGGNILRLDIPISPTASDIRTMPSGQMYSTSDGSLKMKVGDNL